MEQSTAASSRDLNGNYHMYKDHLHPSVLCNRTSEGNPKNMPLFHSNLHNASMCASQDGRSATQVCAGCTPIEPFQGDGCDTLVSSSGNIDVSSSLHEPNSGLHESSIDETMRAHIQPAPPAHSSPEALLDVISTAQKKLQHLQALAELLVQVGGQAQQQQSLVASMKSVMSQLYTATAGFCGQPAPVSASASQLRRASIAQLSQALDLTFDDFSTHEMNMFTSSCLGSILGAAPNEGFFPVSNTLPCSETAQSAMELVRVRSVHAVQMGPDLTRSAMGHVHGGPGGSKPSGTKDPQLKKQRFNSSGPNPIKHNNTSSTPVENRVSNESPHVGVETCESGHGMCGNRSQEMFGLEDHDYASIFRDDDDEDVEGENLPPGSYELVEMAAAEILAEHTHFCEICGKGFKRDANLRMHMRGHGDEYKTPAALARPDKCLHSPSKLRRYSCPYVGCKRNKKHRKFQPLKTTLCVKNHYRRSHCPKLLICSKCKTKKFSVVADLKTHEKHCGQDKWLCSCGTTFSRKDKLVGHVSLFVGHTPAVPIHEMEGLNEQAREEEGLEGHATSKPSYLTAVDSFSMSSENGQTLMNTLMTENDNGMRMTDTTIMGKEVLMSENYGQQKCPATRVHPGEKSSLADNFERGAMEVMQHCG